MRFNNVYGKSLLLLLFMSLASLTFAQRTITGTVTDSENGEPLIGANILVVGTTNGATTDLDGTYSLKVPEGATTLAFSYIGYSSKELPIGVSNVMDVQLNFGEDLQEVVVIGYGEVKREDATGSIQTVSSKDFNKGAITSAQDLVVGKISGVNVTPSSDPGGGSTIKIRGTSTIYASSDPLIVVDGIPIENSNAGGSRNFLNFINPNDIETMTVLKDASATAIYGSRASGGVILITTKKGKGSDKFQVNYNGNFSISQITGTVDVLTADDFRAIVENANASKVSLLGEANTDWQSEIYNTAIGTDHNVNLSGGVDFLPYRLSVGYTDKKGVLMNDQFDRTTLSLNLNPTFLDNTLQVNFNTKAMFSNNNFVDRGAIGSAVTFDPTQAIKDENSPYGGYFTWTTNSGTPNTLAPVNPLAMLDQDLRSDKSNVRRYVVNGSVDYRMPFLKELRANLNLGYDNTYGEGEVIVDPLLSSAANDTGSINDYWNKSTNSVLEFYLNYTKDYKFGKIDLMGGYSWQHFYFNNYSFTRNFTGNNVTSPANENPSEYYLASLFSRLNYTKGKFLLTATIRRDGSSRFSPETRWGLFPSVAAGYKIIEDKEGVLNSLKFRVGYGVTGQQAIGSSYPYMPVYTSSQSTAQYPFGGTYYTTLRPDGYDANIKWEETATYNAGLDFVLLDNKLSGSFEVYQKLTTDLLNEVPVAIGSNLTNRIVTNVGDMKNNGIELSLNSNLYRTEDWNVQVGVNGSYQQNEVTNLLAATDTSYQGIAWGGISGGVGNNIQMISVGQSMSSFWVQEQVYDENGNPIEGEYVDRNGDGNTSNDFYHYKDAIPDWFFGVNGNISYKQFDFSFSGRAQFGGYIYNNIMADLSDSSGIIASTNYLSNVHQSISDINFNNVELFSDHFVQKADFFRMDHITLAYNFNNIGERVKNLKVSFSLQNAFIITNYEGLDPEVGGIDNNAYPRARTYLLGVSATF